MSILIYQRTLPHYRVPIFNRLDAALGGELVVCYGASPDESFLLEDNRSPDFDTVHLQNNWFDGKRFVWQSWYRPLLRHKPEAVIAEDSPRILSLFPLIVYCKSYDIPVILWGHGGSRERDVAASWHPKDFIHRLLVRMSDAFISYTDGIKDQLSRFVSPQKLFVARNTLDTPTLFELRRQLEKRGQRSVRRELGLERTHYLIFIGRLLADKRVGELLDVLEILQESGDEIGVLIIGDGPQRQYLEKIARRKKLDDVHFLGAIRDWEVSAPYLYASDVLVNPGYVGLSVNHAYCFGTPVVTQETGAKGPFHSPEIEYVQEGETGYRVANGDQEAMANAVKRVLADRSGFNQRTVQFAEQHLSVDRMVDGMIRAIRYCTR